MQVLLYILLFLLGVVICITYSLCLFVVTAGIVIVVLAIIYGVCHTILEIIRAFRLKKPLYTIDDIVHVNNIMIKKTKERKNVKSENKGKNMRAWL